MKLLNYLRNKYQKRGFTLVETLVAVGMLSVAIGSAMSLIQTSLLANTFSQQQIIANYLAGDAIEYIRNIRDTNILTGDSWLTNMPSGCSAPGTCILDTINDTSQSCSGTCPPLKLQTSGTGYYQHASGDDSPYIRSVQIQTINAQEIVVKVRITGTTGIFANSPLVVVEHLFNWEI